MHAGMRQQRPPPPRLLLLRLFVPGGPEGTGAGQTAEGSRKLRTRQAGCQGTVVVMEMMMGVRKRGVCAFLTPQNLGAGPQALMAAETRKHGELG